ncbi:hypothetical protein C3709_20825 [Lelliottia aquatilis]|uniref:Uncharacterized protein n=1 Tax=Lelliottia aquatilis TaxID=2080838 RepID=A0ABX4ZW32_9ENTR|nr:hypothetical protein [Lelliottia aquatilis]POZ24450.1 hypothetical protein C3708_14640 [Lelliottia sp. 7254-16]POZ19827.1 hypothetical protein C3712_21145 [Lelliottia aquatilis]POZ21013.1 hypothetical protein C3711_21465 [Lelliottia aquatilis]POZ30699.1 hypothetical protein C3710_21430 [Lelliottia aquatilis]
MPGGAVLTGPTVWGYGFVGPVRRSRHPALLLASEPEIARRRCAYRAYGLGVKTAQSLEG